MPVPGLAKQLAAALALSAAIPAEAQPAAPPIPVVAAENFYGDIARQIGGAAVAVDSILANPDQDPHLFEASPSVARAVSAARIVIESGADYDPWMASLLRAARGTGRITLNAADLSGHKAGDNPHIWYDPATMLAVSRALADALVRTDPPRADDYRRNLAAFEASVQPVQARMDTLRVRLAGIPVTATEPVFGYVFAALGMTVRNQRFQLAVMNNTEPRASDVAAFEADLRQHRVRLLVYNAQASDPVAERMERIARAAGVPVVGAAETEPPDTTWQAWMLAELDAVDRALPPMKARP